MKQESCWPEEPELTRANEQQETSIICVTYVRTSHGRWFAPHQATRTSSKAWPLRRGHANATRPRRPAKSCGGDLAGYRCHIDVTAMYFVDWVLFFFLQTRAVRKKVVVELWALGRMTASQEHRTARPTAQRSSVASTDSLRMTAVEHRAQHTHTAASPAALVSRA